jgi:DNA polymerase III subunit delta'
MAWERIRGHDAVVDSFRAAYTRGRFGQAYLFVGPEGVGKRLFAL